MKVTIYELLGLVKDGKAPKKIKTGNIIYELDNKKMIWADEIYHEVNKDYIWLNFKHINSLNDEVEIIEPQEHKIPEKFKVHSLGDKDEYGHYVKSPFPTNEELMNKINEILDYLEEIE